jgi:hypothetical protein
LEMCRRGSIHDAAVDILLGVMSSVVSIHGFTPSIAPASRGLCTPSTLGGCHLVSLRVFRLALDPSGAGDGFRPRRPLQATAKPHHREPRPELSRRLFVSASPSLHLSPPWRL